MFPVYVKVRNADELKKVYELLGDGDGAETSAPTAPATPATPPAKAPRTPKSAAATAPATAPATPVATATALSAAGKDFLQNKLAEPVTRLSMQNEPAMKAIVESYGVERVSLIPEAKFPEVLEKVLEALDPGYAERKRLEAMDAAKGTATAKSNLL